MSQPGSRLKWPVRVILFVSSTLNNWKQTTRSDPFALWLTFTTNCYCTNMQHGCFPVAHKEPKDANSHSTTITISACKRPWGTVFSSDHGNCGRLIELHEQEVLWGQQDVPWLRRRGSKNSRKLLYFVEWAQECKMSDLFFCCWSESYHMSGATGFEDSVTLFGACMALHRLQSPTSALSLDRPETGIKHSALVSVAPSCHHGE